MNPGYQIPGLLNSFMMYDYYPFYLYTNFIWFNSRFYIVETGKLFMLDKYIHKGFLEKHELTETGKDHNGISVTWETNIVVQPKSRNLREAAMVQVTPRLKA